MEITTLIIWLLFITSILLPLFAIIIKDGVSLFRAISKALEDKKITEEEIDNIIKETGDFLKSLVKILETIFVKTI